MAIGKWIPPIVLVVLLLGGIALASGAFGGISFGPVRAVETGAGLQRAPSGYTPWPVVSYSDLLENGAYARFLNVGHGKVILHTLSELGGYTAPSDGRGGFALRSLPFDEALPFRFSPRGSDDRSGELPPIVSRNVGERDDSPGSTWSPVHDDGGGTTYTGTNGTGGEAHPPNPVPLPGANVFFASGLAALAWLGRNRLTFCS